jgi:hypothetical protein
MCLVLSKFFLVKDTVDWENHAENFDTILSFNCFYHLSFLDEAGVGYTLFCCFSHSQVKYV